MIRSPLLVLVITYAVAVLALGIQGCGGRNSEGTHLSADQTAKNGQAQTIVEEHMTRAKQIAGDAKLSKAKKQELGKQLAADEVSKLLELARSAKR